MTPVPHDLDLERTVLASLMGHPAQCDTAFTDHGLEPAHFYAPDHQQIADAIRHLHTAGVPPEPVNVTTRLRQVNAPAGSDPTRIASCTPEFGETLAYSLQVLVDLATRRQLIRDLTAQAAQLANPTVPVNDTLTRVEQATITARRGTDRDDGTTMAQAIRDNLERWEKGERPELWTTGLPDLDRLLNGGLEPGKLIVLGARPGMGKSALGLHLAAQSALHHQRTALLFSMEMRAKELAERFVAANAGPRGTRLHDLTTGSPNTDWSGVLELADDTGRTGNLRLWDTGAPTVETIVQRARAQHHRHGHVGTVIVDYVGLLAKTRQAMSANEHIAHVTGTLKQLALDLPTTVVALAQLNRNVEDRTSKVPQLSDLRDSGSLEQDADQVWFLYRPEVYAAGERPAEADIIVPKHRGGQPGSCTVLFDGERQRFASLARREHQDQWTGPIPYPNAA